MDHNNRFRMDLIFEQTEIDEETRTVRGIFKLHPTRYERREIDGQAYFYDKLDNVFLPEGMLQDMVEQLAGHAISFEPQTIGNAADYVESRRGLIQ